MRRLILLLLFALILPLLRAEAPAAGTELGELTLANGRVLRNVVVLGYTSQALVARWEGGRGTLLYTDLSGTFRQEAEREGERIAARNEAREQRRRAEAGFQDKARETALESKKGTQSVEPVAQSARPLELRGQAFLSGGTSADVQVKFTGMRVTAYPLKEALWAAETTMAKVDWPKPLASTTTDAEGRWSMTVPGETPFLLVARGVHFATRTGYSSVWEWRVPDTQIEDPSQVMLTDQNSRVVSQVWINRRWRDQEHQQWDKGHEGR